MKIIKPINKPAISAEQMVAARGMLRWRQVDLAEQIGISPTQICDYERGLAVSSSRMKEIVSIFENEGIRFLDSTECYGVILRRYTSNYLI